MGAQPATPLNGDGPVVISGTGTVITPVVQMETLRLVEGASATATLKWLSRPVCMNPNASARPPLGTPGRTLPPAAPTSGRGKSGTWSQLLPGLLLRPQATDLFLPCPRSPFL